MRIVVVGGGIVGLASAYYLAEQGVDVVVCERSSLGAGSTERSAGGIRQQFSTRVNVELSRASVDAWEDFEAEFGVDIAYRRPGYLFLAREDATAERFAENVAVQNDLGVPSELLDPEAARERCPELRAEQFVAATYCPTDGFADPHLALQGFARGAREAGADVRTGVAVTDVLRGGRRADGGVTGVETESGRVDADFVVNAAGPWAREVAAMADVDLPIAPKRRQIAVVDPETPVPASVPLTVDLDTGAYFRPEREGAALVGGHFSADDPDADPDAFDRSSDLDWTATAVERAADCAGYFGPDSRVRRGWAGLYAVTPDHHPIVEETVPGLVTAAGFSGHGFQHAPATGQIVAELVCDGEISLVDASGLDSARFEEDRTVEERNVA
ncbi:NAD(P)/FAD-dependent oxidoreductase [Halomicrococcus sp. NG-SE-24]|uniref:NAD(P)/FAD-dependent oxidoreductase n=1 Tax=Halomicrococcus sp. NG-SE-24 TaxID=3436928 RepID=UPI003D98E913